MNREQMIAWLMIEGWRYYPAHAGYLHTVRFGPQERDRSSEFNVYVTAMVAWRDGEAHYVKAPSVRGDRVEGNLSDAPTGFIEQVYEAISRQMP